MSTPFTFQPGTGQEEAEYIYRVEGGACDLCLSYEDRVFKESEILAEFPYAMFLFENIIEPRVHPNCRCQLRKIGESLIKEQKAMHKDFIKIQNQFITHFCKSSTSCDEALLEFNSWVADLGLNVNKAYGTHESFKWAAPMIQKWKADEKNTYYKVPFAFPLESMNGNVYTEAEIKGSVESVIGKSPSINHWDDTREEFIEGGVKYIAASYEDGACEAILKVPNNFICPLCDKGKPLTEWIDEKKIVNVSLEASCTLGVGSGGECLGLEFDAPTLLTSDTLPGIPMARIYPLEKTFAEALTVRKGVRKVKKRNVQISFEEELPDSQNQCPPGMIINAETGICEQDTDCPDGQHWSEAEAKCVPDVPLDPETVQVPIGKSPAPDQSKGPVEQTCPDGQEWNPDTETCVPIPSEAADDCPPGQVWDPETETCVPEPGTPPEPEELKISAKLQLRVAELELSNIKKANEYKTVEEQLVHLNTITKQLIIDKLAVEGELKASKKVNEGLEKTVDKRDKTILEREADHAEKIQALNRTINDKDRLVSEKDSKLQRIMDDHKEAIEKAESRLDETSLARDNYKETAEDMKGIYDALDVKYNTQLDINLGQTKKMTALNEELLEAQKQIETLGGVIKKSKRMAKVIVSMKTEPEIEPKKEE